MTRAFIAAALVALVIIAAVFAAVTLTPGAFGSGDQAQQSAPAPNARVIAVDVRIQENAHKRHDPVPEAAYAAPARIARVSLPVPVAAPRAVAPAPRPGAQAPIATKGQTQHPATPARPQAASETPIAPLTAEARTEPPAKHVPQAANLDGTDQP